MYIGLIIDQTRQDMSTKVKSINLSDIDITFNAVLSLYFEMKHRQHRKLKRNLELPVCCIIHMKKSVKISFLLLDLITYVHTVHT
jgi:hypothetical protein